MGEFLMVFLIYILVVILYIVVGSYLFTYKEDDWELVCNKPIKKSKETQRIEMIARAFFWPIVLITVIVLLPSILADRLSERIINKKKEIRNERRAF